MSAEIDFSRLIGRCNGCFQLAIDSGQIKCTRQLSLLSYRLDAVSQAAQALAEEIRSTAAAAYERAVSMDHRMIQSGSITAAAKRAVAACYDQFAVIAATVVSQANIGRANVNSLDGMRRTSIDRQKTLEAMPSGQEDQRVRRSDRDPGSYAAIPGTAGWHAQAVSTSIEILDAADAIALGGTDIKQKTQALRMYQKGIEQLVLLQQQSSGRGSDVSRHVEARLQEARHSRARLQEDISNLALRDESDVGGSDEYYTTAPAAQAGRQEHAQAHMADPSRPDLAAAAPAPNTSASSASDPPPRTSPTEHNTQGSTPRPPTSDPPGIAAAAPAPAAAGGGKGKGKGKAAPPAPPPALASDSGGGGGGGGGSSGGPVDLFAAINARRTEATCTGDPASDAQAAAAAPAPAAAGGGKSKSKGAAKGTDKSNAPAPAPAPVDLLSSIRFVGKDPVFSDDPHPFSRPCSAI